MSTAVVLNPVSNVQNVLGRKQIGTSVTQTLQQLVTQLLDISGPYSRNAFLMHNIHTLVQGMAVNTAGKSAGFKVFTRDGRKTLSAIEYASPIQRYLKDEIIAWIGDRVDNGCSDGTTSSMIFTASFLMSLMAQREHLQFVSTTDIETLYNELIVDVEAKLENTKITVDQLLSDLNSEFRSVGRSFSKKEARKLIAYMQAYTSSSGNEMIAEAVATVVSSNPIPNGDDNIIHRYTLMETDEVGVRARQNEYEFTTPVQVFTTEMMNKKRGTYFETPSADVLVMRTGMTRDTMVGIGLKNYLANLTESQKTDYNSGKYLVILIPSQSEYHDSMYLNDIVEFANTQGVKIFVAAYQRPPGYYVPGPAQFYLDALAAKAGVRVMEEIHVGEMDFPTIEPYLLKNLSVKFDYHRVYIDRVIDYTLVQDKEDYQDILESNIHPAETYPELYPYYVETKEFLENLLVDLHAKMEDPNDVVIKDIKEGLLTMATVKAWHVHVFGKEHDRQMFQHILDDAAGASTKALRYGVYFNGPTKLFYTIATMLTLTAQTKQHPVKQALLLALFHGARDMMFAMFGTHYSRIVNTPDDFINPAIERYGYLNVYTDIEMQKRVVDAQPFQYLTPDTSKDIYVRITHADVDRNVPIFVSFVRQYLLQSDTAEDMSVGVPPCQVGNLFNVLFMRLREVALRLVFTDNIVAPGTVWDDGQLTNKIVKAE